MRMVVLEEVLYGYVTQRHIAAAYANIETVLLTILDWCWNHDGDENRVSQ